MTSHQPEYEKKLFYFWPSQKLLLDAPGGIHVEGFWELRDS